MFFMLIMFIIGFVIVVLLSFIVCMNVWCGVWLRLFVVICDCNFFMCVLFWYNSLIIWNVVVFGVIVWVMFYFSGVMMVGCLNCVIFSFGSIVVLV